MSRASNLHIVPGALMTKSAFELFQLGFDTADIAFAKALPESTIYNWISQERERRNRGEVIAARHGMK